MEDTKNKINVYKLLSANDLVRNQRNIESVLLSGLVQGHEYVFEVSPISGWLYFENTHLIFKQNKPKLPASEEEIKQIIAKYWAQVYKKQAVRAKMNKSTFDFPFLLPQNYELSDIQVVFNPQTLETDHLLCRLSIALTDSVQNKPLPILGSGIDLRIGHNGQIIGFLVRWRPLLGAILTPLLPYKPAKHQHAAADENKEAESEPVLVFELCGENSIQTHLCPYYFIPLGHHSGLLPASMASFVIVFSVENNEQNTVVSVHINGGSGDFTYEWSYLKVELSDVKDVVSAGR
ncbi:MAG: hypothetical protein RI894_392, partial [Bacteroidota bacterium]